MQAIRLITQMMSALLYLYDIHNIIHRDIKPENILVFKEPLVYHGFEEKFHNSLEREITICFKLCGFSLVSL